MKRVCFAKWMPLVALALAVPASAIAASDEATQNPTTAVSGQAKGGSDTRNEDQSGAAKDKGHGPTAVMDRATPAQKSGTTESSNKHAPTARMDQSTPNQKSPGSKASGDADIESTKAPSTAK